MDPQMIDRYFTPEGSGYRLDKQIRDRVRFAHLNLQTDPYPDRNNGTADVDIIFCRNVMIYFRTGTIETFLRSFYQCLKPRSYLFLGHSESLASITTAFSRLSCDGGFFYQRREASSIPPDTTQQSSLPEPAVSEAVYSKAPPPAEQTSRVQNVEKAEKDRPEADFLEAERAFQREDFKTAKQKYDIVLRQNPRHVGALLGKGFLHANRSEYDKALLHCREVLDIDDLTASAYFLLGLIRDFRGETTRAMEEYRKAVMLDIDFIMPHYNLGKIYQRMGRERDAGRELDNTVRLLEKLPDEGLIPYSGGLSKEVFLEICREDRETIRT